MSQSAIVITTDSNDVVGELHDRPPVILEPEEEQRWLDEGNTDWVNWAKYHSIQR